MKTILVQNNLIYLRQDDLTNTQVIYAPVYHSEHQLAFFNRRFNELRKIAPRLRWSEVVHPDEFDAALAWDAIFEKEAFGAKLLPVQNRLFTSLPFDLPKTFTPFNKLISPHLPEKFPDAIAPWDADVISELAYYFDEKALPLTYLDTRNQMTGRDGSTKFSMYLACGVLDVRYLYNRIRDFEGIHGSTLSTQALTYELLWREYFYWHYQIHTRAYFSKAGIKGPFDYSPFSLPEVSELHAMTSNPFFKRALTELTQTGFLHNRTRQIFASVWINDLGLDWRAGALLFEEHLIDYDVYSNYGNWMYLAGVGVDPRGKRYFNVAKQLETYDSEGKYLR